LKQNKQ